MVPMQQNVSLKLFSTMRLGGSADFQCTVTTKDELLEALVFAKKQHVPFRVIGVGSNIIWRDEGYKGLVIVNRIEGYTISEATNQFTFGAGMLWDDAVRITVEKGFSGLECLSLIPGTVGATPVQNVGAYGTEVKDSLVTVEAYDTAQEAFVSISNADCAFGYRTSRFKTTGNGRFVITHVTFALTTQQPQPPFYDSLQQYLTQNAITDYSPASIRKAIIAIRTSKLPDPAYTANNGSFFANPVISAEHYTRLLQQFPAVKAWQLPNGQYKVAAGWLIEAAGFSDFHDPETGMATWHKQNLVLVNESATKTALLMKFASKITEAVQQKFNITLEREPEVMP